ncbi:uncharacterized protein LOC141803491 [Halichoeres trimaculatus]|uniref:uncharacterized protein LOC141803491 n=1 Tax=Halichoeres trimaculatus TaxID=147232 RepID=UPI003D9F4806
MIHFQMGPRVTSVIKRMTGVRKIYTHFTGDLKQQQFEGMSNEQLAKQPKCSRCRHHGITVPQKGHSKICPYLKCVCRKCNLITERTRISTLQRNLRRKAKIKEQHPRTCTVLAVNPVPERPGMTPVPERGASPSAASVPVSHATSDERPLDLRYKPAGQGESEAGLEKKNGPPFAPGVGGSSSEDHTSMRTLYFHAITQNAPQPVIRFPFEIPGHHLNNFTLHSKFTHNMMWFPAVEFHNNHLHGPMMLPHFQPEAMHYPPPYQPGSSFGCSAVFNP